MRAWLAIALLASACSSANTRCGPGTILAGGECIVADAGRPLPGVDAGSPDAGSSDAGSAARDHAYYDLRAGLVEIPADGYSRVPVLAIGRHADGSPALDDVVLRLSRTTAGSLDRTSATLGLVGTTLWFTPCSQVAADCLGPLVLDMALASAPSVVVASASVMLVAPEGVGTSAPCLGGGNVLYLDGEPGDYIHAGTSRITEAVFTTNSDSGPHHINVHLEPAMASDGLWWDVDLASPSALPLAVQVYDRATRWPFEAADAPGLDISGDGRGCNMLTGRFQIETLTTDSSGVVELTAIFEQHCEGGPPALHGCVHYAR